ncbi:Metallo-dependent hydrolase [Hygrophoropsis aurantiaca]|uniref:Metallo-dependent hydrolase n=1 Tax=Hygrophoropsis aurantiaca TaxID=72124 RepID=A0ACB8AGB7_9AGAM|nr:Metallo-dependent hydrolase [Hygrophoropsis aurantiaca]
MSPTTLAGPAAAALASLSSQDIAFLEALPKAELHAHLNGSIPINTLLDLANAHPPEDPHLPSDIFTYLKRLQAGVVLSEPSDFFMLFPAIYALTSTPEALAIATRAVLESFLCPQALSGATQCTYLELRTTPRSTPHMSRYVYLTTVLAEIDKFPGASLIISIDRRMSDSDVRECVDLAISLHGEGRKVAGLDLCGDPTKGDMSTFEPHFKRAKKSGLGLTVHIAELPTSAVSECFTLLDWYPDRLGHATFLDDATKATYFMGSGAAFFTSCNGNGVKYQPSIPSKYTPCVEICLTSNLLWVSTVPSLDAHHIQYYLEKDHPIAISTDDTLPFRTSLLAEYALLLAKPPLGIGLTHSEVAKIAQMSLDSRFTDDTAV